MHRVKSKAQGGSAQDIGEAKALQQTCENGKQHNVGGDVNAGKGAVRHRFGKGFGKALRGGERRVGGIFRFAQSHPADDAYNQGCGDVNSVQDKSKPRGGEKTCSRGADYKCRACVAAEKQQTGRVFFGDLAVCVHVAHRLYSHGVTSCKTQYERKCTASRNAEKKLEWFVH